MTGDRESTNDQHQTTIVSAQSVRHAIARCILGRESAELRIGSITLYPHQASAVCRIRDVLQHHGGAMLFDTVGLGKTYTALAVAASYDDVLIVAPAVLRTMWRNALDCTGVNAEFASLEALSRGTRITGRPSLIIVDEAHHLRNSSTQRYAELARLCISAQVLLVSATPIHNSRGDLSALAALFIGHRAHSLTAAALSRLIVRRAATGQDLKATVPRVEHAPWRVISGDDAILDRILALPSPVPPSDGGTAATLVALGLARQWVSSSAALLGALRRRIARSHAMLAALDVGRYPSRTELQGWVFAEDAMQLAFPELLPIAGFLAPELRDMVAAHAEALRVLAQDVTMIRHEDELRGGFVRHVMDAHEGEKVVVFTSYKETAAAVYRSLRGLGGIALMTSRGGTVAGGTLTRVETLERFAPDASEVRRPAECDDIRVLVTTDLLSEGVNLQDASVVIHLDLPWTYARLEQRVGRVARMGSRHAVVMSYAMCPSARVEALLKPLGTIERKARMAGMALGSEGWLLGAEYRSGTSDLELSESIRVMLEQWLQRALMDVEADPVATTHAVMVAAVSSRTIGAIAACVVDGNSELVVVNEATRVSTDARSVSTALARAGGAERDVPPKLARRVLSALELWYEARCAATDAGADDCATGTGVDRRKRAAIQKADVGGTARPFTARGEWAQYASLLRAAASTSMPIALERLVYGKSGDSFWAGDERDLPLDIARLGGKVQGDGEFAIMAILLLAGP